MAWRRARRADRLECGLHGVYRRPLTRAGWFTPLPGPTGGYELVVDLDAVSVLELAEGYE